MANRARRKLNVSMFAPEHAQCGIRDYTAHLIEALDSLPEIASTRLVAAPPDAARPGILSVIRHYKADALRFRALGQAMNAGADIAHVQHQYFLFGGVAPYRTHIHTFLDALTIPAVLTMHEIAQMGRSLLHRTGIALSDHLNFLHPKVSGVIVHTDADRQQLIRLNVPRDRLCLVRHAVPPARPMPDPATVRLAWEQQYPELKGRRIVTVFGFLSLKKGHTLAMTALSSLPEDVALVFAGGQHPDDHTDYVSSLRTILKFLPGGNRVIITDYLPDERVPEIMALTDVALAPFTRSSGSGSLANLIAYGRAVVASDIEPHRELLDEEPELLSLFPAGSVDGLAIAATALLDDRKRRERLQRAALQYAARHTYLQMAQKTVQFYRKVLDQAPQAERGRR